MSDENTQYPDEDENSNVESLFDNPEDEMSEEEFEAAIEKEEQEAAAEPAPRDPADVIVALNEENTELKNKAMSLLADMENLRRRTEREVKDARQYAVANFARDMLSVSDNMSRALQALPDDAREGADETLKTLLEGVEMTDRDLQNQLSKNGVVQLSPEGEKFDPNFHQAMFEVPNTEIPNGTVVQVVQAGYQIGDRVLRPAMVGISKGGPKAAAAPVVEEEAPQDGPSVDKSV